jgi:hypothetical protein
MKLFFLTFGYGVFNADNSTDSFELDESSPDDVDYEILSKPLLPESL